MNYEAMTDREIDALVAERLSGEAWPEIIGTGPSSSVSLAFDVVADMHDRNWYFSCAVYPGQSGVSAEFMRAPFEIAEQRGRPLELEEVTLIVERGKSLPRAICIAALRALDA